MNTSRFDTELSIALRDPNSEIFTSGDRLTAMMRAIREYTRYKPLKRRIGTGTLIYAVAAGANKATLSGGPYRPGDQIVVDVFGSSQTVTVATVQPSETNLEGVGTYTDITTLSTFAVSHPIGAFCQKELLGIRVVAGTDTYLLPFDFISVQQDSFDLATGSRTALKKYDTFYGAVQVFWGLLSGVGWGLSQGFRGGNWSGPLVAVPDSNGPVTEIGPLQQRAYILVEGPPSLLSILPAPNAPSTLDFYYNALRSPDSVPDADMELLLLYAIYSAVSGKQTEMAGNMDVTDDDVSIRFGSSAKSLADLAQSSLNEWNSRLRKRAIVVSG